MVAQGFESLGSSSLNHTHMKSYLKVLALVSISFYSIVSFVSFTPNPSEWGSGGRGAFVFFAVIVSVVIDVAFTEYNKENPKNR